MENRSYVLGIDMGTGGARVGIFDLEGNPVTFCGENYPSPKAASILPPSKA